MGYYSTYNLTVNGPQELIEQFREECENAANALDEEGNQNESAKWYDSDADMIAFAAKHPEALFMLHSVGEEGEQSCLYCKGGKHYFEHSPDWTPPPFDATKFDGAKPYTIVVQFRDPGDPDGDHIYIMEPFGTTPELARDAVIDSLIDVWFAGADPMPERRKQMRDQYCALAIYEGHLTNLVQ